VKFYPSLGTSPELSRRLLETIGARRLALCALALLGVVGLCLRSSFNAVREPAPTLAVVEPPGPTAAAEAPVAAELPPTTLARLANQQQTVAPRVPPAIQLEGPQQPHPITPAHERLYRENDFVGSLNSAMDVKDAARLRRTLAQYREEYPEDSLGLQAGYALIADCLEHPGAATEAAARHYYETERASTLRRHVRKHCLTAEPAP
jgi:hypothetical protein